MREAVICEPVRTPAGKYGGVFADVPAAELAARVLTGLVERTGLDPAKVDDVILGQCYPNGEAPAIGRVAALDADFPITVPGQQLDRRCGCPPSRPRCRDAGPGRRLRHRDRRRCGVDEPGRALHRRGRFGYRGDSTPMWDRIARGRTTSGGRHYPVEGGMRETAENLRREFNISREGQDQLAYEAHQRAIAAQADGRCAEEIVPVTVRGRRGEVVVDTDEHIRHDITLDSLAALRPVRLKVNPASTVTAGNASGQNDGAAACIVTTPENAEKLGLRPLAKIVTWAAAGAEPHRRGIGPVPSAEKALARVGLTHG